MHLRFAQIRVATSVCTGGRNCPPDSSSAMGSSPDLSLTKDKREAKASRLSLCKDYKKDIFGRFAYDFELSQNILSFLI